MLLKVPETTPAVKSPPSTPSALQAAPVTVPSTLMPKAARYCVAAGRVSDTLTLVAVALPAAFATATQYSTTAPGIILGLVVPLNGSLITRLVLVAVRAAARTL